MTIETLRSLRDRAAAATGADRRLDDDLFWQFSPQFSGWENVGGWWMQNKETGERKRFTYVAPLAFTASLDASVALVERMLPGWGYQITRTERGEHHHSILSRSHPTNLIVHGQKTGKGCAALALICAMLDALIEQAEGKV